MSGQSRHFYEFGGFRLEPDKMRLWRNNDEVHLTPKALKVLLLLVRKKGEIVSREELLDSVWKDIFIEEGNINFNISIIRKTLQEKGNRKEKFIQTVPKRGYRFVADVAERFESEEETGVFRASQPAEAPAVPATSRERPPSAVRWHLIAIILLGVLLVSSFTALWKFGLERELSTIPVNRRDIQSIAILPVKPINQTEDDRLLSIGLTDALISRLGRLNRFAVRPLTAVDNFLDSKKDALQFGNDLKVDAVLEGTVIKKNDRLRLNFRFLDVRDGAQIWSESFDASAADLLEAQDVVSARVARNLVRNLNTDERKILAQRPTGNARAYDLYLQGRFVWNRRGYWNEEQGPARYFEQAVALDPEFSAAYLGLADAHAFTYNTAAAERALQKALELDPQLAEAHATQGFLRMFHYWDWPGAEAAFRKAIEISPNEAKVHHWYAVYLSLVGRLDEAKIEMHKALELDPTSLIIMADLGQLYYFAREYDRAEEVLDKVLALDSSFPQANKYRLQVLLMKGRRESLFEQFIKASSYNLEQINEVSRKFSLSGLEGVWRYDLRQHDCEQFSVYSSLRCAEVFDLLGNEEQALAHLEFYVGQRSFLSPFINIDPIWDNLRGEARFQALLDRLNLPK